MKLLIVANYAKQHINKFHIPTIKKFKDNGWTVDVACNADAGVEFCDNLYNLPIERNPFRLQSLKAIKMLKKIIEQNNYDVIHLHTLTGRIIGTLSAKKFRKKGLKLVVTYHGLNYYKGSSIKTKVLIPLDRYLSKFTDLAFSDNQEDIVYGKSKGLKMDNCTFCPISINTKRLLPIEEHLSKRNEIRKTFNVSQDETLLVYVAELHKNKNQILLLKVLQELISKNNKVRLMLVGPENDNGETRKNAVEMNLEDKCIFTGWRSDVGDLLCASDIYVASSIREGLGINLIEAMLVGLPIVATNNRGHREVIEDGKNGYLVPLDNQLEFSKKVEELIKDKSQVETFIKEGHLVYKNKFSQKTEEIIYKKYKEELGL